MVGGVTKWAGVLQIVGGIAIAVGVWLLSPAVSLILIGAVSVVSGWAFYSNRAS